MTGFETRKQDECEEKTELDCRPITLKKVRTEIREQCDTFVNKTCELVERPVPRQKCQPSTVTRCQVEFTILEEETFTEECWVEIKELCSPPGYPAPAPPGYRPPVAPPPQTGYGGPARRRRDLTARQVVRRALEAALARKKAKQEAGKGEGARQGNTKDVGDGAGLGAGLLLGSRQGVGVGLGGGVVLGVPRPSPGRPAPLPRVTVQEVAGGRAGCRTLATTTCARTPVTVSRKAPYERCRALPDVDCVVVLEQQPELDCQPEV